MTLIDALAALQEGAVPTNEQTLAFIRQIESGLPLRDEELSKPGTRLVSEVEGLLQTIQDFVKEKNDGEYIQEFLWRTRGTAGQLGKNGLKFTFGKDSGEKGSKDKKGFKEKVIGAGKVVQQDSIQAGKHLKTLVRLILVQPELRHIVGDLGYVFAEVVDKTAGGTLENARDHLGQVQSSTGTFQNVALKALAHARAQKAVSQTNVEGDRVEELTTATALSESKQAPQQPKGNLDLEQLLQRTVDLPNMTSLREQLSATFKDGTVNLDTIHQELLNGKTIPALEQLRSQALESATSLANNPEDLAQMREQIKQGKIPSRVMKLLQKEESAEATQTASDIPISGTDQTDQPLTVTDLVDAAQMLAVVNPQTHLKPAQETINTMINETRKEAKENFKLAFNEDVQERLIARTKKLLVDCQSSQDYKDALTWFIERIESVFSYVQKNAEKPNSSLDKALSYNAEPLVQFLESFSTEKHQSIRPILETAKQLSVGAKDDPKISSFWSDSDKFLKRCLLEEGFILTEEADKGLRELIQRFKSLSIEYREKVTKFIQGVNSFFHSIKQDALFLRILSSFKGIFDAVRKEGWKPGAIWQDVRYKILPPLLEKFGAIPIPRIKYNHPDFDLVIENIALTLKTLLPDTLDFRMTNEVHLDFTRIKDSSHCHSFKLKIKGMSLRVYKLAFAVTTRFGFTFHDKGIADLLIKNFGLTLYIDVPKNVGPHFFIVKKVKAKLGALHLKVYESNHKILHFLADRLINSYLTKRVLRHFIAEGVTLGLKELDVYLMTLRLEKRGKEGDVKLEDIKRQMAELRDLLKKYHEQIGTIEIDFTRDDNLTGMTISDRAKAAGKSFENSHAVKWVKKQVEETGKKEIVRNEWRSNAFDLDGMDTVKPPIQVLDENAAKHVDGEIQESVQAAEIRQKPEGPTNQHVVNKAVKELDQSKKDQMSNGQQNESNMKSNIGKEIVANSNDPSEQAGKLENVIEKHAI